MIMATTAMKSVGRRTSPATGGQSIVLHDVDWRTYKKVSDAFRERHIRFTYDRGMLEIMTLSSEHESPKKLIGRFVDVLTEELNLPVRGIGSTTLRRKTQLRGLEPDDCYYVKNAPLVLNKKRIDLRVDPPPDLAVEVDVTSSSVDRMGIYAVLRVPEVWRYDGQALRVFLLNALGEYVESDHSLSFPTLPVGELNHFLGQWLEKDDTTIIRQFRAWVREKVVPASKAAGKRERPRRKSK